MAMILASSRDGVGTIVFNRPEKRNSFSAAMLDEFIAALNGFKSDGTRVVVVRADKEAKVWSAGLDIGELPTPGKDPLAYNHPIEVALRAVQHLPAPVIAMVEGGVWGAACDLCLTCDILIGAPSASFAITPAKVGVPYNSSGILHFLNVAGVRIAKEMFFTAAPIGAERALAVGILNHLVPVDRLEAFTYEMAARIAENSPLAISVIKEQLRLLAGSFPLNPETFEKIQSLREKAYDSADYLEGTKSFFERRKPRFTGK
jgi:methylmalonyl-CoA decarboxylase